MYWLVVITSECESKLKDQVSSMKGQLKKRNLSKGYIYQNLVYALVQTTYENHRYVHHSYRFYIRVTKATNELCRHKDHYCLYVSRTVT